MQYLSENRQIPIRGEYDVIVAGGGVAGVAAAVSAARQGAKTLLLEKTVQLGGLATTGYVVIYLPLCDGCGRRLISGISEELLLLSIRDSYHNLDKGWMGQPARSDSKARYRTHFNAASFALHLDEYVVGAGVDVLFDTLVCGAQMDGSRCKHLVVENADGRSAYACKQVIDATGDAAVLALMGAPLSDGLDYLTCWGYYTDLNAVREANDRQNVFSAVKMLMLGADCSGRGQPEDFPALKGVSAAQTTRFLLRGRQEALKLLRSKSPSDFAITALPGMPQYRTSRMLAGEYGLRYGDSGLHFDDAIGCCGDWRKPGVSFEIPYRTLYNGSYPNVLAAGRIISCGDAEAWEVARVIPVAAMTGEAAGYAAAHACRAGLNSVADVPSSSVRDYMAAGHTVVRL